MSVYGPLRRSLRRTPMTAIEGQADISWMSRNRREWPIAEGVPHAAHRLSRRKTRILCDLSRMAWL